jgi:hypothetical protein
MFSTRFRTGTRINTSMPSVELVPTTEAVSFSSSVTNNLQMNGFKRSTVPTFGILYTKTLKGRNESL